MEDRVAKCIICIEIERLDILLALYEDLRKI